MKDEANGKPITEFCGLRSKMYCYLQEDDNKIKCSTKAKGIQPNKIKQLTMAKYKAAIFGNSKEEFQQKVTFNSIRQRNHVVNTVRITKIGLCGLDDKKWVCSDNIHTLAHGHYRISQT